MTIAQAKQRRQLLKPNKEDNRPSQNDLEKKPDLFQVLHMMPPINKTP